jgi:hypothetical protein
VSVRLDPEEVEAVCATTLEFGLWACRIISCKCQARSGKTEAVPATATLTRVESVSLIRPGLGEADALQTAA